MAKNQLEILPFLDQNGKLVRLKQAALSCLNVSLLTSYGTSNCFVQHAGTGVICCC